VGLCQPVLACAKVCIPAVPPCAEDVPVVWPCGDGILCWQPPCGSRLQICCLCGLQFDLASLLTITCVVHCVINFSFVPLRHVALAGYSPPSLFVSLHQSWLNEDFLLVQRTPTIVPERKQSSSKACQDDESWLPCYSC
jgi:hypothetical protein